jgi:N-carbamoyl-L-amino-acid hydrolase
MIRIDRRRLLADMHKLAEFGKAGTGVHRPAFSSPDIEARAWLRDRMADAGLDPVIDGVGNVFGRSGANGPGVLIGSHSDSVPNGGWLDGALGVVYGIEIARAAAGNGDCRAVDVISFEDEEGSYLPLLGSRSFCGELAPGEIDGVSNASGASLVSAIADAGVAGRPPARFEDGRYRAYLEAHIEQGPRLEAEGRGIGIVTAIVGIRRFRISFAGRADHAGTTPMDMRSDAGAASIRTASKLIAAFERDAGPASVWNIGKVTFEPGVANVVPGHAEFLFEFRDTESTVLDEMEKRLFDVVNEADGASPVAARAEKTAEIAPTPMDPALGDVIEAASREAGVDSMRMPSGGGHDAMVLARYVPSAMLFVPSIGGRSHDIEEDTDEEDIVLGCEVMAAAVDRLLG